MIAPRVLLLDPRKVYRPDDFLYPPHLGLEHIAATLREQAEVRIVDLTVERLRTVLASFRPGLVGINCHSYQVEQVAEIALRIKRQCGDGTTVVAGGPHPSVAPGHAMRIPWLDAVVVGEGEETLRQVAAGVPWRRIAGLVWRRSDGSSVANEPRPWREDLDSLPLPARDLRPAGAGYHYLGLPFEPMEASRGCLHACTFCSADAIYRQKRASFSPARVVREMRAVARRGPHVLLFWDLDFLADPDWVARFVEELRESRVRIPFSCMARCDSVLSSRHLLRELRALGLVSVTLGLETPSDAALRSLAKGATRDQGLQAATALRRAGITVLSFFMVGFPDDDRGSFVRSLLFGWRAGVAMPIYLHATPLPATRFFEQSLRDGTLHSRRLADFNLSETPVMRLDRLDRAELRRLMRLASALHAIHPGALSRLLRYYHSLRPRPRHLAPFLRSVTTYLLRISRKEGWTYYSPSPFLAPSIRDIGAVPTTR